MRGRFSQIRKERSSSHERFSLSASVKHTRSWKIFSENAVENSNLMRWRWRWGEVLTHTHTFVSRAFCWVLNKVRELQHSISVDASSRTAWPVVNKGHRFVSQTKGKTKGSLCISSTGSISAAFCWVWRKLKDRRLPGLKETVTL